MIKIKNNNTNVSLIEMVNIRFTITTNTKNN